MSKLETPRPARVTMIIGVLIVVLGVVLLTSTCGSQEPEQIAKHVAHSGFQQPVLAGEVVADDAGRDTRALGDARDRGVGQP